MTESERAVVKTYVPRYQKETWKREAAELGMSQSEFVATMVQAGRSDIGLDGGFPGTDPRGDTLESRLEGLLGNSARSWEELRDEIVEELEATLESMQDEGRVRHSPGEGYVLE